MQKLLNALFIVLLISSGCVLASPSHRRAAVAGHWGSETVTQVFEFLFNSKINIKANNIPVLISAGP